MSERDGGGLSLTTAVVIVVVVLGSLSAPVAGAAFASLTETPTEPLQIGDAKISSNVSLVKGQFHSGTYHFTRVQILLSEVVGQGELVVQIGIPELNSYVLTWTTDIDEPQQTNRTINYQPSVEFHPRKIEKQSYAAQITVRIRSGGSSRKVSERTVSLGVRDE